MSKLLSSLASAMLLSPAELDGLIRSAPHRYKVYKIPKRKRGEYRTIAQPAREVKALQYWIIDNLLRQRPVHPAAMGYRDGRSIKDNAERHAHSRFLLKMDFEDFFPSIESVDFEKYANVCDMGLSAIELQAVMKILFWRPKNENKLCLSIGAPSSPIVSNLLMEAFDRQAAAMSSELGAFFTRYADDLSFSANESRVLRQVERGVAEICRNVPYPYLRINEEKTVRVSRKTSRRVTGLVLTNDERVSIGREEKRRIRSFVHYYVNGRLSQEEFLNLKGTLAFVNSVEPSFLARLRNTYGSDVIREIQTRAHL